MNRFRYYDHLPQDLKEVLQNVNMDFDPILNYRIKTKQSMLDWMREKHYTHYKVCIDSMEINDVKVRNKNHGGGKRIGSSER